MPSRALADRLIKRAAETGITLAVHGDTLRYCPKGRLREPLEGLLRRHKTEVLAALTDPPPPGYDSITCALCVELVWSFTGDGMARCARRTSTTDAGEAITFIMASPCPKCGSTHHWRHGESFACAECNPPADCRLPRDGGTVSVGSEL